jgi:hypothetical protein
MTFFRVLERGKFPETIQAFLNVLDRDFAPYAKQGPVGKDIFARRFCVLGAFL